LAVREGDGAVTVEVEEGVLEQLVARQLDDLLARGHVEERVLADEGKEVRERLLAAVPVAAAAVLHARDRDLVRGWLRGCAADEAEEQKKDDGRHGAEHAGGSRSYGEIGTGRGGQIVRKRRSFPRCGERCGQRWVRRG